VAWVLAENQDGPLPGELWSLGEIGEGVLQALKRAEDGDGLIVRLRDVSGVDRTVHVRMQGFVVEEVMRTDAVERNLAELRFEGRTVSVPVTGNGLATIRLRGKESGS
jgi:alpha-mannosidase